MLYIYIYNYLLIVQTLVVQTYIQREIERDAELQIYLDSAMECIYIERERRRICIYRERQ